MERFLSMALRFQITPSVYLILRRGEEILLMRRANTGHQDGNYSVVAGHIKKEETPTIAVIREALEEVGISVKADDVKLVQVVYRALDARVNFFFAVDTWKGEPYNKEEDKCDDVRWFPIKNLPGNMAPYVKKAIIHYFKGIPYMEY
ncbi:NUDIX domain-containing protein [Candidatus Roizmanbacteria bacterium]|nr:NUDIX domain-containing protein [Candidatus Roizmanbacteria bacterium]